MSLIDQPPRQRHPSARFAPALITTVVIWAAGCAEERAPAPPPTTRVTGTVRLGGSALTDGWVEFMPTATARGVIRSARISADGHFEARGVAVGPNVIRVVTTSLARGRLPGSAPFLEPFHRSFLIRRTMAARPAQALDLDLAVENALRG